MAAPRNTPRTATGQRGVFTPLAGGAALLLATMALGALFIGRLTVVRTDTQRTADSASMAAVQLVRELGLPFDTAKQTTAEIAASTNAKTPLTFAWTVQDNGSSVDIAVTVTTQAIGPAMFGGARTITSRAAATIAQIRFDDADRRLPKLALVLDYSGSMNLPFVSGGIKIDVLEDSVAGLLAANLMIDYGGVLFSTEAFETVPISANAPQQINDAMDTYGAGGSTNAAAGLSTARNILVASENTGYYALFVSDGAPDNAGTARNAAEELWNGDITIFTLEIRDDPPNATLAEFMTDIAGTPSDRGSSAYHFVAASAADLTEQFRNIVAAIVCSVGPLAPPPQDPSTLRVFLVTGTNERRIDPVPSGGNILDYANEERFSYDPVDAKVRLTVSACDAIVDAGDDIAVRFDRPELSQ